VRAPINGIVTGFRIRKGTTKDSSDYGLLDILQPGDKDYDSSLTFIYVQETDFIAHLLTNYSSGQLRFIKTFCIQVPNGREHIWILKKILSLSDQQIPVQEAVVI
jgi:hypothetical protein